MQRGKGRKTEKAPRGEGEGFAASLGCGSAAGDCGGREVTDWCELAHEDLGTKDFFYFFFALEWLLQRA